MAPRPRVGLIHPYWSFWERSVPYDLRAERQAILREVEAALAGSVDVVLSEMVASPGEGRQVALQTQKLGLEALLVVLTMAAPPDHFTAGLADLAGVPLVLWALQRHERIPSEFDHGSITSEGATVGAPMLTSVLTRRGRPFELVVGRLEDSEVTAEVATHLQAATAARRLSRARIGMVGHPPDGYECVELDADRLRAEVGATLVPIEATTLLKLYQAVSEQRVGALELETRRIFAVAADAEGDSLARSLRAACAIEDLVSRYRLDAGVMNCHVPEIRFGQEIGVAPCFGLGRMTSAGVPWTCAGDALTAVAMLTLKLLGAAATYHELEAMDLTTGEFAIANTGEHDLAFSDGSQPLLLKNLWFAGDPHCGVCAQVFAPAGPATLLAFAQLDSPAARHRLIVAPGEFTERRWPGVGTSNAAFRFRGDDAAEAWRNWCLAGANHHSAATPGDLQAQVERVARHLSLEVVGIPGGPA